MSFKHFLTLAFLFLPLHSSAMETEKEWNIKDYNVKPYDLSVKAAFEALRNGSPNVYIGNPEGDKDLQMTPLIALINYKTDLNLIKRVLEAGADVNQCAFLKDSGRVWRYPLEYALEWGQLEVANLLLERGADKRLILLEATLLKTLAWGRYGDPVLDCVKLLVQWGANPYEKAVYRNGSRAESSAMEFINKVHIKERDEWKSHPEYKEVLATLQSSRINSF